MEPDKATSENVKEGDIIVVVRNGSRALIGKHAEIKESMSNTVIGAFMSGIRSEHSSFVNALLDTNQFEKEIEKNMGATINQITGYMFSKMEFTIPSPTEQDKIGNYFKYLDHLITLHQRKLFEAKNNPKNGSKNFFRKIYQKLYKFDFNFKTYDWEQRKFGELYEKVSRKNDMTYGTEQIISVANMYYKVDANVKRQDYLKTYNIFELGDIAFEGNKSKHFAHGRFVENTIGNGIVSHVFDVFKPIMDFNLSFWKYYINYEGVMGPILTRVTKASTMMTNLVAKDFLNEDILVPSIAEQQKIGEYLSNLDHLITLHQRKCEQLKELKKFMLQNMFPKKG